MSRFSTPPLKRHEALQPFSRDHYVGLVQAQHLMKSAKKDDAARRQALREFLDAWASDIVVHFDDEERLLPELLDEAGRQRMMDEHARLRALAAEGQERRRQVDPGAQWIETLGRLLDDHIRWEERELFTAIQQNADTARLDALAAETQLIEQTRPRARARGGARAGDARNGGEK